MSRCTSLDLPVLLLFSEILGNGGIQRFNRNLVDAVSAAGAEVDVVSLNDETEELNRMATHRGISRGASHSKIKFLKVIFELLRARKYRRVVCGHINMASAVVLVLIVSRFDMANTVLVIHGIEVWGRVNGLRRWAASHLGRVLAVSSFTAESYTAQMGRLLKLPVVLFPNSVMAGWPISRRKGSASVRDSVILLSVARLDVTEREKGIADVLKALALIGAGLGIKYVIVGEGNDRHRLQNLAQSLGIHAEVEFMGALTDDRLLMEYSKADVFVLPSRKEGFGIVYLEAMSFGLPVIAVKGGGSVDVVEHETTGLLVEYGDVDGLCNAIRRLTCDRSLRERLGCAGQLQVAGGGKFSSSEFKKRCAEWII